MTVSICRECGAAFQPFKTSGVRVVKFPGKKFCTDRCRSTFMNRRMQRGAQLYDLFRAMRREREAAREANLWTSICRLEEKWQEQDERERPGRRSYVPMREALDALVDDGKISRRPTPKEDEEFRERVRQKARAAHVSAAAAQDAQ